VVLFNGNKGGLFGVLLAVWIARRKKEIDKA